MRKSKAIFRYPGGKFKAIKYIKPFWEYSLHNEYREPFLGGGSVYINKPSSEHEWINDIDNDLMAFYRVIADIKQRERLISELLKLNITKDYYKELYKSKPSSDYRRALRFYVLNRCSFSGITVWNSYIGQMRYNINNTQDLIREVGEKLKDIKITSIDFEEVINSKPMRKDNKVFLFIDPPYAESRQQVAYNHYFNNDDHIRLANTLKKTNYDFLLTYDDCNFIRDLYDWAYLYERTWTYSVANSRVHHNPRESGNELFISNIKLPAKEGIRKVCVQKLV